MVTERHFTRVKFATRTRVEIGGTWHEAQIVDISLKGALVSVPDDLPLAAGLPCNVEIHLDPADLVLPFGGEIVHYHERLAGIKFTHIAIDSMIHLRRLVELNSSDPDRVRTELNSLIGAE